MADMAACNLSAMITVDTTTYSSSTEYATDVFQDEDGFVGITSKRDTVVQIMSKYGVMFLYSPKSGREGARMHGCGSSQKSIRSHQVVYYVDVQEFAYFSKGINHVSYFFERLQPPERPKLTRRWKFITWKIMSLNESGWGPPCWKK